MYRLNVITAYTFYKVSLVICTIRLWKGEKCMFDERLSEPVGQFLFPFIEIKKDFVLT